MTIQSRTSSRPSDEGLANREAASAIVAASRARMAMALIAELDQRYNIAVEARKRFMGP